MHAICPTVVSALSRSCCLFDFFSDKLSNDDGDDKGQRETGAPGTGS